jgi:hypothetical protein
MINQIVQQLFAVPSAAKAQGAQQGAQQLKGAEQQPLTSLSQKNKLSKLRFNKRPRNRPIQEHRRPRNRTIGDRLSTLRCTHTHTPTHM